MEILPSSNKFPLNKKRNLKRWLCAWVSCLIFLFSGTSIKAQNPSEDLKAQIQKYLDKEEYSEIFKISSKPDFQHTISSYSCYDQGKISHLIGMAFYYDNQDLQAIDYFKKVISENWVDCPEVSKTEISNSIFNIGVSYQYTDQILKGKTYIDSALVIIESIPNYPKVDLALKYQGAGSYYADVRDFTKSETYLNNAEALSEYLEVIDRFYIKIDLLSLYLRFKKFNRALQTVEAIDSTFIIQENILDNIDVATYYLNSAEVYLRLNDYQKAEQSCLKSIDLLPKHEFNLLSNAYETLGVIYHKKKDFNLGKEYFDHAYRLRLDDDNILQANIAKSFALENLAELEFDRNKYFEALTHINEAIQINSTGLLLDKELNPVFNKLKPSNGYHLLRQLILKDKILYAHYESIGDSNTLIKCLQLHNKLDTLTDEVIANAYLDQSKLELLNNIPSHSSKAIDICLELYKLIGNPIYLEKAFYFSSRAKAVALQKLIATKRNLTNSRNDSISIAYLELKDQMRVILNGLQSGTQNKDSMMELFSSIQLELENFESKNLSKIESSLKESKNNFSIEAIQESLGDENLLIDAFHGENYLTLFYIYQEGFEYKRFKNSKIEPTINALKASCLEPLKSYDDQSARSLYSYFFSSLNNTFENNTNSLIIIPHGILHGLPFEALIDPNGDFLIETRGCSYAHMLSMVLDEKSEPKFSTNFVGMSTLYSDQFSNNLIKSGLEIKYGTLGNLNLSNEELKTCSKIFGGKSFYNSEANINNFYQYALTAKIVYLSLHGIVNKEDGANSSLIFDDRNQPFLLRAYELNQTSMAADLVILSACNSADGKLQIGEGINGLTRSFLASGVKSVISSMWPASEGSSLNLLPNILKKYKSGQSKISAVQQAKVEYLNTAAPNLKHPYYWANFILFSGIETKISYPHTKELWFLITVIVLILIVVIYFRKHKLNNSIRN